MRWRGHRAWRRLMGWLGWGPEALVEPGVNLEEVVGVPAIPCAPMHPLCVVGVSDRGPAEPAVRVTSFGHYMALYGVCPRCGATPFDQFLPGLVVRWGRVWYAPWRRRAPYAVICRACKEVVGWEWDGRQVRAQEEP